ncbi:MAG TPA: helix-turn-helix transcriptional regulator, partial [Longimicrobium sp.]
ALLHHTEPFARFAGPRWLPDVRAELDEHPGQRSVGEIARSLGLHPTYLTRRFRAEYGCSVTQYRRRVRLLSAAQALASPAMSLARAAYQQGFADQSHLCREVRRELGVTPSALRELIGG